MRIICNCKFWSECNPNEKCDLREWRCRLPNLYDAAVRSRIIASLQAKADAEHIERTFHAGLRIDLFRIGRLAARNPLAELVRAREAFWREPPGIRAVAAP